MVLAALLAVLPWAAGQRRARTLLGEPPRGRVDGIRSLTGNHPVHDVRERLPALVPHDADAAQGRRVIGRVSARPVHGDPALLLDLVAVALAAGAAVPAALAAVGSAWPGPDGEVLDRAARSLVLGAPWDVAWTGARGGAAAVAGALRPAWSAGASPVPLLRTAADRMRSRRRAETRAAAGRLGVQLVLPLGLCYLPAFVLVGLLPVVVSLASGLLG